MNYILINPVVEKMYGDDFLQSLLSSYGYTTVKCRENWAKIVKEKYKALEYKNNISIVDVRCPDTRTLLSNVVSDNEHIVFPDIEPILIHCGREISQRKDLKGYPKIVVTPCRSLAEMGNNLNLEETEFISWSDFLKSIDSNLEIKPTDMTPIPLGYFNELNLNTDSISGNDEIITYFKNKKYAEHNLIEILCCELGCHNGDGVTANGD